MATKYFRVDCILENDATHSWGVTYSQAIRTPEAAAAFASEVVGVADDRPVTRLHWRDPETGEYTSIKSATGTGPFYISPSIQQKILGLVAKPATA